MATQVQAALAQLEVAREQLLAFADDIWHYGLTHEELDFILNYDIKYRMGAESGDGDEGEE